MLAPRRFLPSINALLALEAVDRLGSASAAAQELSLTQGAVSRQVKALEGQLGVRLVDRSTMRLTLTPAGADYVSNVRSALTGLAEASLKLKANPTGGTLELSILPAFAMHFLAPRLRDFSRRHPEVTLTLNTRLRPFDFRTEPFHAAIHFGQKDWPGVRYLHLMDEFVKPVAAPELIRTPIQSPLDIPDLPLLHLQSRPDAWDQWLASRGVAAQDASGMLFDQFGTMMQAAIHGLGVALMPTYLSESEIAHGRLIALEKTEPVSLGAYYLVWPDSSDQMPVLAKFHDWLGGEFQGLRRD